MFTNFKPDRVSLQTDPNLSALHFHPGSHAPAFSSEVGQHVYGLITSRFGVAVIIGAVVSAPSRPPVVALEPLLLEQIGEAAFTDPMKKLTGRIVRFVIEHLGGRWVRRGIKVSTSSRYRSGSVYSFATARPAAKGNSKQIQNSREQSFAADGKVENDGWHNAILDNPVAHAAFQQGAYQQAIDDGVAPNVAALLYLNSVPK